MGRPRITVDTFGLLSDGTRILRYQLVNCRGMSVAFVSWGGTLVSIVVPDRDGAGAEVTLGHDRLEDYVESAALFGGLIGRYANRIAGGRFTLDGVEYRLSVNDPPNHLHGGVQGFHRAVWEVAPFEREDAVGAVLTHISPAGDEGYPGSVHITATRTLTNDGVLTCEFRATTDAPTHLNLTQHPYFNLGGTGDVLDHELTIHAERFTPVDATSLPTGERRSVVGTPFDFRNPVRIGSRMHGSDEQLSRAGGYDHNFELDPPESGSGLRFAARLRDPASGRVLDVHTTEPGLQVYTGNRLDGVAGRSGLHYGAHAGIALETQHFPDSPNQPSFPSTRLDPGETYRSRTIYRFHT